MNDDREGLSELRTRISSPAYEIIHKSVYKYDFFFLHTSIFFVLLDRNLFMVVASIHFSRYLLIPNCWNPLVLIYDHFTQ